MTQELKINSGRMFPDSDPKSDKHPVASGPANIEGKEYRMALWKNKAKNGGTYYSVKFSEFQEKPQEKSNVEENDKIPF